MKSDFQVMGKSWEHIIVDRVAMLKPVVTIFTWSEEFYFIISIMRSF